MGIVIAVLLLVAVVGVLVGMCMLMDYADGFSRSIFVVSCVAIVILAPMAYNRSLDYRAGKCERWGSLTNYETKFAKVGFGCWECFAKVDTKWIPSKNVRTIAE